MDPKDQRQSVNFAQVTAQGHTSRVCPTCSLHVSLDMNVCPNDGTVLSKSVQPKMISNLAGQYEFIGKIGEGGMGVIYKARHLALNNFVAIKMMHVNQLDQTKILRFQQEAKAVSTLDHPSIVRVRDFGISEAGQPHMVLDYIDGVTLDAMIKTHGPLSLPDVKDLFSQICDAVAHAHQRKVLHRDLKPSNIMLVYRENACPLAVIVDFGIAKVVDPSQQPGMNLTQTGEIFGSPFYMSPEQTAGKELDQRSDIYSVGCVLYEALTGAPPFVGNNAIETLIMHTSSSPPSLKEGSMGKIFPERLQSVINKALAKDPKDRFQDMTAFKVALIDSLDQTKVVDPTPIVKTKSKTGSKLLIASIAVSAVLIGVGGFALSSKLLQPKPSSSSGTDITHSAVTALEASTSTAPPVVAASTEDSSTENTKSATDSGKTGFENGYLPTQEESAIPSINKQKDNEVISVSFATDKALSAFDNVHKATEITFFAPSIEGPGLAHLAHLHLRALSLNHDTILKDSGLRALESQSDLEDLDLNDGPVTDEGLGNLRALYKLRKLLLGHSAVSGAGLLNMQGCRRLEELDLSYCKRIEDRDLGMLQVFKDLSVLRLDGTAIRKINAISESKNIPLKILDLNFTPVDDDAIKEWKQLPKLAEISLGRTAVTSAGLAYLASAAPRLKRLNISGCKALKNSDLSFLKNFKELKQIDLGRWKINDSGLNNLVASSLTDLDLGDTKFTDTDLNKLIPMKSLTEINLKKTDVTRAGAKAFHAQRPDCKLAK